MGQELTAEADAEHGNPIPRGGSQKLHLGSQIGVAVELRDRLLAAERDDPVDLVERRQRGTAAKVTLVEPHPCSLQDRTGVPEER